jgi:sugar lactone lactonase YvrE
MGFKTLFFFLLCTAAMAQTATSTPTATPTGTATPTPTPLVCPTQVTGTMGSGNGQFNQPNGAAVYGTNLYISDFSNNRIEWYDTSLNFKANWGVGQLSLPGQVAVDCHGNVYVTNQGTNNVMVYNPGNPATPFLTFGTGGTGNGQFQNPIGIAVDPSGYIYVSDFSYRLQKFTSSGAFVTQWGGTGSGPGQFNGCAAIAIDSSNNIYVADTNNYRIEEFTSNGAFITQFGSQGTGPGQFEGSWGVLVGPCGNIYATDRVANFIQVFSPNGTPSAQYGTTGTGPGQFTGVMGIAFDASQTLFTTESQNNRVQKFTPCGLTCPPVAPPVCQGSNLAAPGECFIYPSPARGDHATLSYSMAESGRMDLKIWDEKGELADEVTDQKLAGAQVTTFNLSPFTTGIYFYQVTLSYDSGRTEKLKPRKFAVIH